MPEFDLNDIRDIENATSANSEARQHEDRAAQSEGKKTPGYLAFKFTFTPSRGDVGGAFCMIFEGKTGKNVFQAFWAAKPYTSKAFVEPSTEWRKFVQRFKQMGPLDKDLGEQLQESLRHILKNEDRKALFETTLSPNYVNTKV